MTRFFKEGNSPSCTVDWMHIGAATVEDSREVSQKIKIEIPYNKYPTILLGIYYTP